MEPFILQPDPIERLERTLRDVIHDVLSANFGPDWVQDPQAGLGPEWVSSLQDKARAHQGVQKPEPVYDIPLAYAEFLDLGKLLAKHKTLFEPIFGDWQTFWTYYRTAEKLRNEIKHHRDLSPTQPSLLVGIAGELGDAATLWRIGTRLQTKRTLFQFSELLSVQGKTEEQILEESANCVDRWQELVLSAIDNAGLDLNKIGVTKERFALEVRGQQIEMEVSTAPSGSSSSEINGVAYKGIHVELRYNSSCRADLNVLLSRIGKPYRHIAYDLVDKIDVELLRQWSIERAGLNPSGGNAFNHELMGIDYTLLGNRLRVGASKYVDLNLRRGGRLDATLEHAEGFWRAHDLIQPKEILGFMIGSITPKAMMHLIRLSQMPISNVFGP